MRKSLNEIVIEQQTIKNFILGQVDIFSGVKF